MYLSRSASVCAKKWVLRKAMKSHYLVRRWTAILSEVRLRVVLSNMTHITSRQHMLRHIYLYHHTYQKFYMLQRIISKLQSKRRKCFIAAQVNVSKYILLNNVRGQKMTDTAWNKLSKDLPYSAFLHQYNPKITADRPPPSNDHSDIYIWTSL